MINLVRPWKKGNRLLLIKPSTYDADDRLIRGKKAFFPTRSLPHLAGLTPSYYDIRILDDMIQDVTGHEEADIVAFTCMLSSVKRVIDLARIFYERGIPTVVGGPGVFSLPEAIRSSGVFTSIVHGEAEGVWQQCLEDYQSGEMKPEYFGGRPELVNMPHPRFDLVDFSKYMKVPGEKRPFISIETARGCPFDCTFCGVSRFFGKNYRFRPPEEVVEEMRTYGKGYFILTDDNLSVNQRHARKLFEAIKPLGIKWGGQFDMNIVRQQGLLELAAESGCSIGMIGVESLLPENIQEIRKIQNKDMEIETVVKAFHRAGISFTASMVFGLDHDTPHILEWTTNRLIDAGVDLILPWVLTPGPGSQLFIDYKKAGRLLHENFSLYNGVNVVFKPKHMSPDELKDIYWRSLQKLYSFPLSLKRGFKSPGFFDGMGLNMYFWSTIRKNRHPFTGAL